MKTHVKSDWYMQQITKKICVSVFSFVVVSMCFAHVISTTPDTIYVYHVHPMFDCISSEVCIFEELGENNKEVVIGPMFFQDRNCEAVKLYGGRGTCDCNTFIFETWNPEYVNRTICGAEPTLRYVSKLDYYHRVGLYLMGKDLGLDFENKG